MESLPEYAFTATYGTVSASKSTLQGLIAAVACNQWDNDPTLIAEILGRTSPEAFLCGYLAAVNRIPIIVIDPACMLKVAAPNA